MALVVQTWRSSPREMRESGGGEDNAPKQRRTPGSRSERRRCRSSCARGGSLCCTWSPAPWAACSPAAHAGVSPSGSRSKERMWSYQSHETGEALERGRNARRRLFGGCCWHCLLRDNGLSKSQGRRRTALLDETHVGHEAAIAGPPDELQSSVHQTRELQYQSEGQNAP